MHARRGEFDETPYHERLDRELPVIAEMGFSGYMLIVADFIDYARSLQIPVGPGRGSVVGSLVSYALRITELDPIEHKLLFERWLNPGRKSMPDIDVDFCFERRDEVIDYVRRKYGEERVAQIITFGTIKGKQAIRDVGRVLGLSFGDTDRICKLYPAPKQGRDFPLEDALKMEPRLREERTKYPELFEYAFKLEGLLRHASRHAAGVVIADAALDEMVPLYVDKERTEGALVDHPVLDEVRRGYRADQVRLPGAQEPDPHPGHARYHQSRRQDRARFNRLPLDDADTYRLLARGDTVGVFQMEGSGMRRFVTDLKPSYFDDVIAAGSLFRPGPLERGGGRQEDGASITSIASTAREQVKYPHPLLEPVLRDTYGVIIYQEQVMRVAQALSGYTLEQADILRAAMGKKNKAVMEKERERFIQGAIDNGVDKETAQTIFEQIETFASYGFNRSHAAAYALTTYTTAYLKAHFPYEFMAALTSLDMDDVDKTYKNIAALRDMGIRLLPPDVNQSRVKFTVVNDAIRFGLCAIRGGGHQDRRGDYRGAPERRPVHRPDRPVHARRSPADQPQGARSAGQVRRVRFHRRQPRRSDGAGRGRAQAGGAPGRPRQRQSDGLVRGDGAGAAHRVARSNRAHGTSRSCCATKKRRWAFTSPPIRWTSTPLEISRLSGVTTQDLAGAPDGSQVVLVGVVQSVKLKNNKAGKRYATFSVWRISMARSK